MVRARLVVQGSRREAQGRILARLSNPFLPVGLASPSFSPTFLVTHRPPAPLALRYASKHYSNYPRAMTALMIPLPSALRPEILLPPPRIWAAGSAQRVAGCLRVRWVAPQPSLTHISPRSEGYVAYRWPFCIGHGVFGVYIHPFYVNGWKGPPHAAAGNVKYAVEVPSNHRILAAWLSNHI